MSKVSNLPTFTSAPNSSQMNDAFTKITEAFDNTVSRDGSSPNTMSADLDLNSNDILNVNTLESENVNVNGTLTVNGSPIGASIPVFNSTEDGLVPASGGGIDNFLRADGTWAEPAGGGGGGSSAWSDLTDVPAPVTALSGVNTGDETAAGILTKLLTVDGAGSLLDADMLDGQSSAAFATAAQGALAASASQPGHTHAAADVTAPGSTTQFVFNSGGVLTGAANVEYENNQLRLEAIASPATPASGGVSLFGTADAGRTVPGFMSESGLVYRPEDSIRGRRVCSATPTWATNALQLYGFSPVTTYGSGSGSGYNISNMFSAMRRQPYVSSAAAGNLGGLRTSQFIGRTGDGTQLGGFDFNIRFGFSGVSSTAQSFVGVRPFGAVAATTEPSTLINCIGVGNGAADSNLHIFYGGTTAQTPINLGANFPAKTDAVDIYDLTLYAPVLQTGTVYYRVVRVNTGVVAIGTLTGAASVLPAATVQLAMDCWRGNNTIAAAVGVAIMHISLITDY